MNILLWILQVVLGFVCIAGGSYKITHFEQLKKMNASMRALPRSLWTLVGSLETLAGLGLILPGAIHVLPALTLIAAACLSVESIILTLVYLFYRDFPPVSYTAVMVFLAAFVAYGRFVLRPF